MNSKYALLVLLFAVLTFQVHADLGTVNESMTLYADVISNGSFYPDATDANISIYTPDSSLYISNQQMTLFSIGKFIYNFTPNESGTWYATAIFYNSTGDVITVASQSFAVVDFALDVVEEFDMLLAPFLIIAIGILFAILGQYLRNALFFIVSGIWFMGSAAAGIIFLNSTIPELLMYFLVGLALIYHAYDFFQKNQERNKRFVQAED